MTERMIERLIQSADEATVWKAYMEDDMTETTSRPEIISGDFAEGEMVTVRINGKEFTRRVKYSARKWADLYITINGHTVTYSEFYDYDAFADADYSFIH